MAVGWPVFPVKTTAGKAFTVRRGVANERDPLRRALRRP